VEKQIRPLPIGRYSNVIVADFRHKIVHIESLAHAAKPALWIGGVAEHGKVIIKLDVTTLSGDATRALAKTLLMLADTADAQAAEEGINA